MRSRAIGPRLAASPTMIGAITVMVSILAVFLAYNANTGLPFVPNYRVSALVPNADLLVTGNEVRVGGVRVGLIEEIEPVQQEDGSAVAKLDLKLDPDLDPLPVDSTLVVRARSALGLKYLELNKGTSSEGYEAGAVLPLSQATPEPVEIDEVLSTFDEPTRVSVRESLVEFGNALAGRGPDLNAALGRLPAVLEYLEPVMRNIGAPETGFERFITASAAAAAEVAPVAEIQGAAVRLARHHVHRARRRRSLDRGDDRRDAADVRHRQPGAARDQALPRPQRDALYGLPAWGAGDQPLRAGDRELARGRHAGGPRLADPQPRAAADR